MMYAGTALAYQAYRETGLGGPEDYIVSISDLEELIGASSARIRASSTVKNMLPNLAWALPSNCDLN